MKLIDLTYSHPHIRLYIGPFRIFKKALSPNICPPPKDMNILIVKPDSLGDYVLMRNFWAEIKKKWPHAKLTLLLSSGVKGLAEFLDRKEVEDIFYLPHPFRHLSLRQQYRAVRQLLRQGLKKNYSKILFPSFSVWPYRFLNNILLNECPHSESIGQIGDLDWNNAQFMDSLTFLNRVFVNREGKKTFEFENNRLFFEYVLENKIPFSAPQINITVPTVKDKTVVIAPGAKDESRRYHPINYALIIEKLISHYHLKVILVGTKAEESLLFKLNSLCHGNCELKIGHPLSEIISLVKNATLFIGNDSGLFHLAAACNTRAIAISAGVAYHRFMSYPPSNRYKIIFNSEIKKLLDEWTSNPQNNTKTCPLFGAINGVPVHKVYQAIEDLLEEK